MIVTFYILKQLKAFENTKLFNFLFGTYMNIMIKQDIAGPNLN